MLRCKIHGVTHAVYARPARPSAAASWTPLAALALTLALPVYSHAQDQNPATQDGAQDSAVLDPIEVQAEGESAYGPVDGYKAERSATGLKLDVPLLDTPASVQVVPEDVIDDQRATTVREATKNVSGVHEAGTAGNRSQSLTIRGFDAGRFAKDGFFSPASFGDVGFLDLANVARVEVLKGPASVLYGQIEPGGLVNIVTKKAQFQPFRHVEVSNGFIKEADGTNNEFRGVADLNQPLGAGSNAAVRLNAAYEENESFRDFFVDGENALLAPSIRWAPTNDTTVDLQLEYFHQERQFDRGLVAVGDEANVLPRERFLGERFSQFDAQEVRLQGIVDHQFNETWSLRSMIRYSNSDADRFSADPRGVQDDGETLNRRVADLEQHIDNFAFQSDLQADFDTGFLGHQAVFGADVNLTRFDSTFQQAPLDSINIFNPTFGAQPGAFSAPSTQDRDIDFFGFYVQDLISIGERWKLLLGGRFDIANTEFSRDETLVNDAKDREFSPRAGLMFKPRNDLSLYASYTESFNPFVFQFSEDGQPFDPETGEQIEVGAKKSWFNDRLFTTLAFFQIRKENVLTPDPNNIDLTIQTGEQRSRGIELDITGEILPGWEALASAAYIDAEVTEDTEIEEGNVLPNAPEWSGSLWNVYSFQEPELRGLQVGGGVFFVGEREGDITNTFEADSYARVDLMARYQLAERLEMTVNVENLFDKNYIAAVSGRNQVEPGRPRTVFARLSYDF